MIKVLASPAIDMFAMHDSACSCHASWSFSMPMVPSSANHSSSLQSVYDDLKLDGLWIDMNEPSNYCTGDVCWNDG